MKLSEYKNEDALDLLADIIDPASEIFSDKLIVKAFQNKSLKRTEVVKLIIKNHKKEIIEILASLDGVPVSEYECNILTLPVKLIDILNDKDLMEFFTSQAQMEQPESSGPATVTTKEIETK